MLVSGRVRGSVFRRRFGSAGSTPEEPGFVIGESLRTHTRADTGRRIGRLVVTTRTVFSFQLEKALEDYLEAHLSLPGQRLLIIGRQVKRGKQIKRGTQVITVGARIDLLAIDSTGVIYIIELKLGEASQSIIAQILRYRRRIKRMDREELIRDVEDGRLKINLVKAFQRRFGHPLPETVNESQVLVIVAASIDPKITDSILDLLETCYTVATFRYVVRSGALSFIPCCRSDQDVAEGSHLEPIASAPPNRTVVAPGPTIRVPVDENARRFWSAHAQDFASVVTFRFIYERYEHWVHAQDAEARPRQDGLFGRDLSAIVSESNEWTHVFVPPPGNMAANDTLMAPPSVRTCRAQGHSHSAYQRNPIHRAPEL